MIIRPRSILIVAVVISLAVLGWAQIGEKTKSSHGPRAVAVLEWTSKGLQLVPVSLMIDGQFYDASIYEASPVPMALQSDTVYEAQKSGEPTGDFTVREAEQFQNGNWAATGNWDSFAERAKREAAKKAAKLHNAEGEEIDKPPVLKRAGSATASNSGSPTSSQTTGTSSPTPDSDDRPVLHREKTEQPAPAQTANAAAASEPPPVDESGRPTLRRGKPNQPDAVTTFEKPVQPKAPGKKPADIEQIQVAVSDATRRDEHPFTWKWANPEEEKKMTDQVRSLAISQVKDYARKYNEAQPGPLQEVQIRTYDLTYNNEADLVLTARVLPAAGTPERQLHTAKTVQADSVPEKRDVEYYVTVVAREDIYGQLQPIFSEISDNHHLDAFPRLELVDAVDADGDGRAELLFQSTSDIGHSFVLYRLTVAGLTELLKVPAPQI